METKENGFKNKVRLSRLGFCFELIKFSSILSKTGFVTTVAGFFSGLWLTLYVVTHEDLTTKDGEKPFASGALYCGTGGVLFICTCSIILWSRLIMESKRKNINGIQKIVKMHTYASAVLKLNLYFSVLTFLVIFYDQHLKESMETYFGINLTLPVLGVLVFIEIIFTCNLLHGLRIKKSGNLKIYIIYRYILLVVTLIVTIVKVTMGAWWIPQCGFLAISLGCLVYILDLGPIIIIQSICKTSL